MVLEFEGLKVPTRTTTDTAGITDPNIYADIVDFNGMVWKPRLKITNNEGQDLYFQVKQNPDTPSPARYTVYTTNLGSVAHGSTAEFTNWDGIEVTGANAPTSGDIPSGSTLEETVHCRLEAYTDDAYTNSWGYVDFDIGFVWINSNDAGWTVVDKDNFDDGTEEGWTAFNHTSSFVASDFYRTAPYSLYCERRLLGSTGQTVTWADWLGFYKSFTIGAVSRAFAVLYFRTDKIEGNGFYAYRDEVELQVGGQTRYKFFPESDTVWYKVVIPLDVNATQELRFRTYFRLKAGYTTPAYAKIWLDSVKVIQS